MVRQGQEGAQQVHLEATRLAAGLTRVHTGAHVPQPVGHGGAGVRLGPNEVRTGDCECAAQLGMAGNRRREFAPHVFASLVESGEHRVQVRTSEADVRLGDGKLALEELEILTEPGKPFEGDQTSHFGRLQQCFARLDAGLSKTPQPFPAGVREHGLFGLVTRQPSLPAALGQKGDVALDVALGDGEQHLLGV